MFAILTGLLTASYLLANVFSETKSIGPIHLESEPTIRRRDPRKPRPLPELSVQTVIARVRNLCLSDPNGCEYTRGKLRIGEEMFSLQCRPGRRFGLFINTGTRRNSITYRLTLSSPDDAKLLNTYIRSYASGIFIRLLTWCITYVGASAGRVSGRVQLPSELVRMATTTQFPTTTTDVVTLDVIQSSDIVDADVGTNRRINPPNGRCYSQPRRHPLETQCVKSRDVSANVLNEKFDPKAEENILAKCRTAPAVPQGEYKDEFGYSRYIVSECTKILGGFLCDCTVGPEGKAMSCQSLGYNLTLEEQIAINSDAVCRNGNFYPPIACYGASTNLEAVEWPETDMVMQHFETPLFGEVFCWNELCLTGGHRVRGKNGQWVAWERYLKDHSVNYMRKTDRLVNFVPREGLVRSGPVEVGVSDLPIVDRWRSDIRWSGIGSEVFYQFVRMYSKEVRQEEFREVLRLELKKIRNTSLVSMAVCKPSYVGAISTFLRGFTGM